eukprot:m.302001 g.302001  ORF g.302001 m.302001 type:complete len:451 (+) comp55228_c0_seq3:169-1521(+)
MWRRSTTTSTTDEEEDESLALPGVAAVTSAAPRAIFVRSASSMTPSSSSLSSASPAPTQVFRRHNTIIDSDDDDDENSRNVFRQARAFSDVSRPSDHALAAQRNAASTQRSKDSQPVFRTGVRTESRRDWPGAVSTKEPAKETPLGEKQQEATSMFQPDTRPSVELKADGLSRFLRPGESLCTNVTPTNMMQFLTRPSSDQLVCATLTRSTRGIAGKLFPEFFLHLETAGVRPLLLCAVRKIKLGSVKYVIATDVASLYQKDIRLAVLKSDMKTQIFKLHAKLPGAEQASVISTITCSYHQLSANPRGPKCREIVARMVSPSPSDPKAVVSDVFALWVMHDTSTVETLQTLYFVLTLESSLQIIFQTLDTLKPTFRNNSYQLRVPARVSEASIKNFQLVAKSDAESDPPRVVLVFGKQTTDSFCLDYRAPLCAMTAMAICLTSFETTAEM